MLQARGLRFHCANDLVVGYSAVAHFRGSINCKKCALLAAMLLFHSCFFTHRINQGWANLFNARVICRKPKTPAAAKPVCTVYTLHKYGKEC